jgi:SAM-dependent methyltransferase
MQEIEFRGFHIPVSLVSKTGSTPQTFAAVSSFHIDLLQKYIPIKQTDHVLEVGCGIGCDAIPLTELLTEGRYTGTDTILPSIQWCENNISSKFSNFAFVHHDIKDTLHNPNGYLSAFDIVLPASDESIDLIILQSVFTHMFENEIVHYLKEFNRILKPSGRVWMTVFIVDDDILEYMNEKPVTNYNLSFRYDYGDECRVNSLDEPRSAVAFYETRVQSMIGRANLVLDQPILWGVWSGKRESPRAAQDALVLKRKSL